MRQTKEILRKFTLEQLKRGIASFVYSNNRNWGSCFLARCYGAKREFAELVLSTNKSPAAIAATQFNISELEVYTLVALYDYRFPYLKQWVEEVIAEKEAIETIIEDSKLEEVTYETI